MLIVNVCLSVFLSFTALCDLVWPWNYYVTESHWTLDCVPSLPRWGSQTNATLALGHSPSPFFLCLILFWGLPLSVWWYLLFCPFCKLSKCDFSFFFFLNTFLSVCVCVFVCFAKNQDQGFVLCMSGKLSLSLRLHTQPLLKCFEHI